MNRGSTPSSGTGPSSDVSGRGNYDYVYPKFLLRPEREERRKDFDVWKKVTVYDSKNCIIFFQ